MVSGVSVQVSGIRPATSSAVSKLEYGMRKVRNGAGRVMGSNLFFRTHPRARPRELVFY